MRAGPVVFAIASGGRRLVKSDVLAAAGSGDQDQFGDLKVVEIAQAAGDQNTRGNPASQNTPFLIDVANFGHGNNTADLPE